jgi:hypothetical protein
VTEGVVKQLLTWDIATQTFLACSHEYGYGDNFEVQPVHAYRVCLDQSTPKSWPGGVRKLLDGTFSLMYIANGPRVSGPHA